MAHVVAAAEKRNKTITHLAILLAQQGEVGNKVADSSIERTHRQQPS